MSPWESPKIEDCPVNSVSPLCFEVLPLPDSEAGWSLESTGPTHVSASCENTRGTNTEEGEIMDEKTPDKKQTQPQTPQQMKVRWDSANMRSSYSNVCNVAGTREEIVLLFGMNQSFDAKQNEMAIQLSDRIVMSPFVAKRLAELLNNVTKDYEMKYGALMV
jgi:hypothetical protein